MGSELNCHFVIYDTAAQRGKLMTNSAENKSDCRVGRNFWTIQLQSPGGDDTTKTPTYFLIGNNCY